MDRRFPRSPDHVAPVVETSFARTGNNGELVQDRLAVFAAEVFALFAAAFRNERVTYAGR